jgi:hypothetical protein
MLTFSNIILAFFVLQERLHHVRSAFSASNPVVCLLHLQPQEHLFVAASSRAGYRASSPLMALPWTPLKEECHYREMKWPEAAFCPIQKNLKKVNFLPFCFDPSCLWSTTPFADLNFRFHFQSKKKDSQKLFAHEPHRLLMLVEQSATVVINPDLPVSLSLSIGVHVAAHFLSA